MKQQTRNGRAAAVEGTERREDNWDQRLGFLMHDVSRLRRRVFDGIMGPAGLTRSQWWVLAHVSRRDGMSQSDLAATLDLGKAALGGLVDRLEAAGFLQRRPDPVDRRVKRVYLTARGKRMIRTMRERSNAMSERMLQGLGPRDRQALAAMLDRVKRNLLAMEGAAGDDDARLNGTDNGSGNGRWTSA